MTPQKIGLLCFCIVQLCSAGCSSEKHSATAPDTRYDSLSDSRILNDISRLPQEKYAHFLNSGYYLDILQNRDKKLDYSRFYSGERCLIYLSGWFAEFGPLEEDRYGSLALLYSKHPANTQTWKLDTVLCTYPELVPLKDSSFYFSAGSQRCKLGDCEWFYTLVQLEGNTFREYFRYSSFDHSMYIEQLLHEGNTERAARYLGDTLYRHYDILRYEWQGDSLKALYLQKRTAVLKGFDKETLLYDANSLQQEIRFASSSDLQHH